MSKDGGEEGVSCAKVAQHSAQTMGARDEKNGGIRGPGDCRASCQRVLV